MPFRPNDQKLQMMLKSLNYHVGTLDGIIGKNTRNAVAEYQLNNGYNATGNPDQNTIDAIYNDFINNSISVHGDVLQLLLYYAGYNPGKIDGIIGRNTKNAVYNFQNDHDMYATGNWDSDTIQRLKEYLYSSAG
jgi:peptidoglycan hydrolase-like protein with peptidoglycan-binding domain